MSTRKIRVELFDGEGNRYTIVFEGQITKEKALHLLDLVELLGGMSSSDNTGVTTVANNELSKYEKVRVSIQKNFPVVWFSSRDARSVYEQEFKEPINLSTVATYLARMSNKGILLRAGTSNSLKYKLAPSFLRVTPKQQVR